MYANQSLRNNIINRFSKTNLRQDYGFIRTKPSNSRQLTRKYSLNNFNQNGHRHRSTKKIKYQQLDDYLLNRDHKNRKTVKNLKKEIDTLKNRLGKCQSFIGRVSSENNLLKKSIEMMKGSSTRLSGNSRDHRQDFTRETKQLQHNEDYVMNKYLPQNQSIQNYKKEKNGLLKSSENENNLNYSQESQYQLLTPAHKFNSRKFHQTVESFGEEDIEQLTIQLDNLVLTQSKCQDIQKRRQMRTKILKISEKINILQRNKTKDNIF